MGKYILTASRDKIFLIYYLGVFSDFQWAEREREKPGCRTSTGKTSETGAGRQPVPCRCSGRVKAEAVPGLSRGVTEPGSIFPSSQETWCHNLHLRVTRSSCRSPSGYGGNGFTPASCNTALSTEGVFINNFLKFILLKRPSRLGPHCSIRRKMMIRILRICTQNVWKGGYRSIERWWIWTDDGPSTLTFFSLPSSCCHYLAVLFFAGFFIPVTIRKATSVLTPLADNSI